MFRKACILVIIPKEENVRRPKIKPKKSPCTKAWQLWETPRAVRNHPPRHQKDLGLNVRAYWNEY